MGLELAAAGETPDDVLEPKAFSNLWLVGDPGSKQYRFVTEPQAVVQSAVLERAGQILSNSSNPEPQHQSAPQGQQQQQQNPLAGSEPVCWEEQSQLAQAQQQLQCNALIHAARLLHTTGEQLHAAISKSDCQSGLGLYPLLWPGLAPLAQLVQLENVTVVGGRALVGKKVDGRVLLGFTDNRSHGSGCGSESAEGCRSLAGWLAGPTETWL